MNEATGTARRYHWLTPPRFDSDPHAAVAGPTAPEGQGVLNLVASEGEDNRVTSTELAREGPDQVVHEIERMRSLSMPRHHAVRLSELHPDRLGRILVAAYEAQPSTYTDLLAVPGLGAKGLRALFLWPSWRTGGLPPSAIRFRSPSPTAGRTGSRSRWTGRL
jgi:uncharacterized protein